MAGTPGLVNPYPWRAVQALIDRRRESATGRSSRKKLSLIFSPCEGRSVPSSVLLVTG